jgi:hypothetical protein
VSKNPPSLSIATEKVCFIIIKARQFDVKDVVTDPDDASNAALVQTFGISKTTRSRILCG